MTQEPTIKWIESPSGITDVPGFRAGATACDIRENGGDRLDCALLWSDTPATCAGVFTTHDLPAAPVQLCRNRLDQNSLFRGCVVNSGNANACTGAQGLANADEMAHLTAQTMRVRSEEILVCSTGRIGRQLPMENISRGIGHLPTQLNTRAKNGQAAAHAILTSDTRPKTATIKLALPDGPVTIAGMAKGAGMIEPNMATMLCFLATDANLPPSSLQAALKSAVEPTFNSITIDGDMSTNDTVLLFANGQNSPQLSESSEGWKHFMDALQKVCAHLAKNIVLDGERVTKCVELSVEHASCRADAERVARAVGNSLLVKTSWFGNDPNWGRIADAAGYAKAGLQENKLDIFYDEVAAVLSGVPQEQNREQWKAIACKPEFRITIRVNNGNESTQLLATDLTEGYVQFNKSE